MMQASLCHVRLMYARVNRLYILFDGICFSLKMDYVNSLQNIFYLPLFIVLPRVLDESDFV